MMHLSGKPYFSHNLRLSSPFQLRVQDSCNLRTEVRERGSTWWCGIIQLRYEKVAAILAQYLLVQVQSGSAGWKEDVQLSRNLSDGGYTIADVIGDVVVKMVDMALDRGGWDEGWGKAGVHTLGKAVVKMVDSWDSRRWESSVT
jgi:hypothetical protein